MKSNQTAHSERSVTHSNTQRSDNCFNEGLE